MNNVVYMFHVQCSWLSVLVVVIIIVIVVVAVGRPLKNFKIFELEAFILLIGVDLFT